MDQTDRKAAVINDQAAARAAQKERTMADREIRMAASPSHGHNTPRPLQKRRKVQAHPFVLLGDPVLGLGTRVSTFLAAGAGVPGSCLVAT